MLEDLKVSELTWMMFPLRAGCTMTGLSGMIMIQPSLSEVKKGGREGGEQENILDSQYFSWSIVPLS